MPTKEEVFEKVQEALMDALGVDDDEVTREATMVGDLCRVDRLSRYRVSARKSVRDRDPPIGTVSRRYSDECRFCPGWQGDRRRCRGIEEADALRGS